MKYTTFILAFFLFGCSKDDSDLIKSRVFGGSNYSYNPLKFFIYEGINTPQQLNNDTSFIDFGNVNLLQEKHLSLGTENSASFTIDFTYVSSLNNPFSTNLTTGNQAFVTNSWGLDFKPTSVGNFEQILVIKYLTYSKTLILKGKGVTSGGGGGGTGEPTLVYPASGTLSFGDVYVGSTVTKTISIQNTGTADANWSNSRTEYTSNPSSGTISAGNSQNINISFTPTSSGTYSNNIVLTYNSKTLVIPYTANRLSASRIINLNTSSNSFGNVPKNTTQTKTLTISNTGSQPLNISSVTISGLAGVWAVDNYSGAIPAGGSINVNVRFTPLSNLNYNGTVTVNSDKTSGINTRGFTGTGI